MDIQSSPLPLANVGSSAPRPQPSEQGVKAESARPVEPSGKDTATDAAKQDDGRGQNLDIRV